jgi:hypothetical protein
LHVRLERKGWGKRTTERIENAVSSRQHSSR